MMARAGEIDARDLLSSEQTGHKWVRASSIPDIIPEPEPEPKPRVETQSEQVTEPAVRASAPTSNGKSKKPILAVLFLAAIAIIAILAVDRLKSDTSEPLQIDEPVVVPETNIWENIQADVNALIKANNINEARQLVASYVADKGADDLSLDMTSSIELHVRKQKLAELYAEVLRGASPQSTKKELIALSKSLNELDALKASLTSELLSKSPPSRQLSLCVLEIADLLKDAPLQRSALTALSGSLKASSSEDGCLAMAKVYIQRSDPTAAIDLLKQFVAGRDDSANAWYELSALLAQHGTKDEALEAFAKAMNLGGEEARIDANRDERFEPIKGVRFWWNTR